MHQRYNKQVCFRLANTSESHSVRKGLYSKKQLTPYDTGNYFAMSALRKTTIQIIFAYAEHTQKLYVMRI